MSHEEQQGRPRDEREQPIRYGDVFHVSGDLSSNPVRPQDAAMMQSAEQTVLGQTQKGGPAAAMQSAASRNERAGLFGHCGLSDVAGQQGVTVTETDVPGSRIITESVAGQVVCQYVESTAVQQAAVEVIEQSAITIGEALEAAAQSARNKPVDQSDAAAIKAAEVRATGSNVITPGGLAATAQSAANHNAPVDREGDKIKLRDVLTGATSKLAGDKAATQEDAEGVVSAELRNNPIMATQPGGVAASVAAAARLNESI